MISLSLGLSIICTPVSAEEVTAYQTSILCYEADGSISVGSEYSEFYNFWIKFAPRGENKILSIDSFYKQGNNKTEPETLWYEAGTEWLSPIRYSADDGSGETVFTGGNKTFADGTPTAMTESVTVTLDGEEVERGITAEGGVVEITVENKLKAGNNKNGGWALSETVVYTVYDNIVDVEVSLRALTSGVIAEYNGPQAVLGGYKLSTLKFIGGRTPAYLESDYYKYNSGTKTDYPDAGGFTVGTVGDYGDVFTMYVDREYGLGKLWYLTDSDMPIITVDENNIASAHLVAHTGVQSKDYIPCRMYKDGRIGFKVQYEFRYSAVDMADIMSAKVSDATSVSATLKTNTPIDASNAALKIGDIHVDVKETETQNVYELIFEEPLSNGTYRLTGTVTATEYDSDIEIKPSFTLSKTFEYEISNATENVMLLSTNLPIDTETAIIRIGNNIGGTVEKLANEHNKYAIRPKTPLTAGQKYDVVIQKLQSAGGEDLVRLEIRSVTVEKGVTKITGAEMVINDNGTKAARLTGTNNVVGYSPVVLAAAYTDDNTLCSVDYKKLLLPYSGELPKDLDSSWLWVDGDAESIRAYVFDSLDNLLPL